MTDIAYWDQSYREAIEDVDRILAEMEGLDTEEASQKLKAAKTKMKVVKKKKTSFQMELRQLHDDTQRTTYGERKQDYEGRTENLEKTIKNLETNLENAELLGGASDGGQVRMDNDSYLAKTHQIQDQTEASLQNTIEMMENANEVADETISELDRQKQQINEITEQLLTMEDNIKYADQLIRDFSKRMMTDKCIQIFAMMNMLALVVVIVFAIMQKNGMLENGDDGSVDDQLADGTESGGGFSGELASEEDQEEGTSEVTGISPGHLPRIGVLRYASN
eukprot:CAMPEP_0182535030 /NCGR_PEP_ID=MMETSP1323-20130603/16910_1 /TAXON_ID=236787 /ORGANISM="Florenciella parvula, Strain RCC1693" /LENGTH=278 /DNA_ID=CAMNT_0024745113 /DNA_START=95 /DNA_END=932 /DNA_ORIENTATION=+